MIIDSDRDWIATANDQLDQLIETFGIADVTGLLMERCTLYAEYTEVQADKDIWLRRSEILSVAVDELLKTLPV